MKKFYTLALATLTALSVSAKPMGINKARAAAPEGEDLTVIVNPEGEKKLYDETSGGWVYWGAWAGLQYMNTTNLRKIVWNGDKVYINNVVNSSNLDSYVEGEYADGKITVKMPQCIGSYWNQEEMEYMPLFVNLMETVEQDGNLYYMIVDPEKNFATYDVDEKGNVTLNLGNEGSLTEPDVDEGVQPQYIIGTTYSNEPHALQVWSGYGDAYAEYILKDDGDPVCPPEDAVYEDWVFNTRNTYLTAHLAFAGDDVYFSNLSTYAANFWVKGTIDGDKIVVESDQFLGVNEYDQFFYFVAGDIVDGENGWNVYVYQESVSLDYNKEEKTITSQPRQAWLFTGIKSSTNSYYAIMEEPRFWQQTEEQLCANPLDPSVAGFSPFDGEYWGMMSFDIPAENIKGAILPTADMFYNVYMDGEIFTFFPETYSCFDEPTVDVPYDLSDYYAHITCYNANHKIYFDVTDVVSIGVQSFYNAPDGNLYESNLITYDVETGETTGLTLTKVEKEVASVKYFTLTGVQAAHPGSGLYVKVTTYTDGTARSEKIMMR